MTVVGRHKLVMPTARSSGSDSMSHLGGLDLLFAVEATLRDDHEPICLRLEKSPTYPPCRSPKRWTGNLLRCTLLRVA